MNVRTLRSVGVLATVLAVGATAGIAGFASFNLGDVFAGVGNSLYHVYTNSGGDTGITLDNLEGGTLTTGCAFNPGATLLYTTDWAVPGHVVVFDDISHAVVNSIGVRGIPESVVFRKNNGHFFVGGPGPFPLPDHAGGQNLIQEFDASNTFVPASAANIPAVDSTGGTTGPDWIDLAADNCTMYYTSEGRMIQKFDVCSHLQTPGPAFATLPDQGNAYALRILGNGNVLVADRYDVKLLDTTGAVIKNYSLAGEDSWFALNLDPNGTSFWSGNFTTGRFYRFNITSGAKEVGPVVTGVPANNFFGLCVKGELTAPPPSDSQPGRMTGGGTLVPGGGSKKGFSVSHGFELHCDRSHEPNNLEINWDGGHKFHLESLTSAKCTDDPLIDQKPPSALFDTYIGEGVGRYDGTPGYKVSFTFVDAGEPGKKDTARILITDSTGTITVLDVPTTFLTNGNQQAHKD